MTPPSSPAPRAPSRELDAEIAERVMGYQRYGAIRYGERCVVLVPDKQVCWTRYTRTKSDPGSWEATTDPITERDSPRYSSDIAAAWQVVEKLRERRIGETELRQVFSLAHCYTAEQVAAAICRAALAAVAPPRAPLEGE